MKTYCNYCKKELNRKPFLIKTRKTFFCNIECKSKYQKGKEPWNKGKIGLQKNPYKGVSFEEHFGYKKAEIMKKHLSKIMTGHKITPEQIEKSRMTRIKNQIGVGLKNSMYTNGISYMEKKLKKEIKNCEICNVSFLSLPSKRYVNVHHIDKNRKNNSRENLLLLCASCHMKEHQKIGDRRGRFSK